MNADDLFNPGISDGTIPKGDTARQAVHSLRGYTYQTLAAALAWLDLDEKSRLFLEVAEDYAIIAKDALRAVQVKDTESSGPVTLNSPSIHKAVAAFVDLVERNSNIQVNLRFFSTSEIGTEKAIADRPAGVAGLKYWRRVDAGADPSPLRKILQSDKFPESVQAFSRARDDAALRRDLVKRIQWDCGQPDFPALHQELKDRLIVVGRDRFGLSASDTQPLADLLVYRVLEKSIVKTTEERVLTRAELYRVIDAATRISVLRTNVNVDTLARLNSVLAGLLGAGFASGNSLSVAETGWLIDSTTLPAPLGMIARVAVESAVADTLENSGVGVIVGASGLGKSTVSRAVAAARADAFFIADFRSSDDANETSRRLDMVFARIGGLPSSTLILEDLNHFDDTRVRLSLARVIEALRRRYRKALITCYRQPSLNTLADVGLNQDCVVACPCFSEEESCALVLNHGGDPERWGRLAYIMGLGGHPQLTHAFVTETAERGWPVEEIEAVFDRGLSSDNTDAVRDAARRNLASNLPEGTRNLLYRLSLTIGRFDRSLALTIGEIPPSVSQTGECMDQLIGPWIEAAGKDLFRVSPLARGFGHDMLSPDKQKRVHKTIAVQMLREGTINAGDFDAVMMHAIAGKSSQSLAVLALSVVSAASHTLERYAEHLPFFRFFRTDIRLYPEEPLISWMLRLAQFKLAAAAGEGKKISNIVAALFNEVGDLPEGEIKRLSEAMTLGTVLVTMGIANHLENWVALLHRLKTRVETGEILQSIMDEVGGAVDEGGANFFAQLFSIGSARLASVQQLEHIINELDKLDASERASWLTPIDKSFADYSPFINSPWATQRHNTGFDAVDAAIRYQRMAEKTRSWGIRPLSLQCSVAQAVMLDEYQHDKEGALAVLDGAEAVMGNDQILSRARAKVHWNHDEHRTALKILRDIADQVGGDSPVERAFTLREAAISAAKCDDWSQAEQWFLDAQNAARRAHSVDIDAMAIGLGADSAVAALKTGGTGRGLTRLVEAVQALADIDPEATLRTAYCHRVIRHTVLWARSHITGHDDQTDGQPIIMSAGTCSNPEPLPAIRERPFGHIDMAWYMLAEAEAAASLDVGIAATLDDRLAQGPIPRMEAILRLQTIQTDIARLDAGGFAAHFTKYIESTVYFLKEDNRSRAPLDPLALQRGQVPTLDKHGPFDSMTEHVAKRAILAYGICSALAAQPQTEAMTKLETALAAQFSDPFPGQTVFDHWNEKSASSEELDQTVVAIIEALLQNEHVGPHAFWRAGLRFFEWIDQSYFKLVLMPRLAAWQRAGWERIVTREKFHLSSPYRTVSPIKEVLTITADDRSFVAKLLLATAGAVGSPLGLSYREHL